MGWRRGAQFPNSFPTGLQNHIVDINGEVAENIETAVILLSVETGDVIAVASRSSVLFFKERIIVLIAGYSVIRMSLTSV